MMTTSKMRLHIVYLLRFTADMVVLTAWRESMRSIQWKRCRAVTTIILYVWSIHRRGVGRYLQAGLYKTDSVVGGTGPHKAQMRGDITFWGQDFMGAGVPPNA